MFLLLQVSGDYERETPSLSIISCALEEPTQFFTGRSRAEARHKALEANASFAPEYFEPSLSPHVFVDEGQIRLCASFF